MQIARFAAANRYLQPQRHIDMVVATTASNGGAGRQGLRKREGDHFVSCIVCRKICVWGSFCYAPVVSLLLEELK